MRCHFTPKVLNVIVFAMMRFVPHHILQTIVFKKVGGVLNGLGYLNQAECVGCGEFTNRTGVSSRIKLKRSGIFERVMMGYLWNLVEMRWYL
jgi:hypothetical protein